MNNQPRIRFSKFSIIGFLLFFTTIFITSSISIWVYYLSNYFSQGNIITVILCTMTVMIIGAILCTYFDMIRRKNMIDEPVNMILIATRKIANGNFDINIPINNSKLKYNEFYYILENINKMAKDLSKNEVLKNDFISNVSHEIKTPLAVIQNYAKALDNKNITDKKREECIKALSNQTKKLSSLISNILSLNKLENQTTKPNKDNVNIGEYLRETILQFEDKLDSKNIELECDIMDYDITIEPSYLDIIFNNLISNAIKFSFDKSKINISLNQKADNIIFKVQDYGCGMNKETGERIFEKFYQGDTSHSSEGNGLGLALVKRVIDILGGTIEVESEENKGTTFTIYLKKD